MIIEPLIEANSVKDLKTSLNLIASHSWQARSTHYLPYSSERQSLLYREQAWPLESNHQPGLCALSLRPVHDQSLPWPEALAAKGSYRMTLPIFNWGSLNAVVCLAFDQKPGELEGLAIVERALGALGEKVRHRDMSSKFVNRCKELLVQAVEAQGKKGHIERCSRLCSALAEMLDLSEQVQADLMEAAQFHDVGKLTFNDPSSTQAVREHPLVGAGLLTNHPELTRAAQLVEAHHERFDGSGAPKGLSGNEVPLEGWVLALVESVVEHWEGSLETFETKVRQFFSGPAKHHHPDAVDALCGLVDSGRLQEIL
jgi:HD domain-containing protein